MDSDDDEELAAGIDEHQAESLEKQGFWFVFFILFCWFQVDNYFKKMIYIDNIFLKKKSKINIQNQYPKSISKFNIFFFWNNSNVKLISILKIGFAKRRELLESLPLVVLAMLSSKSIWTKRLSSCSTPTNVLSLLTRTKSSRKNCTKQSWEYET